MRETERQSQPAKRPSNRPKKPTVPKNNTPGKKRISKATKPNKQPAGQAKSKAKNNKTQKEKKENPSDSDDDPTASYKKGLDEFQQFMEGKLKEIMANDRIYKPDADRIMKKFHNALVKERNEMKKIEETYGHESLIRYDSDEIKEEARRIENEYRELNDIIKEHIEQDDQEEMPESEDVKEEANEVTKKTSNKKNAQRFDKNRNSKNDETGRRETRSNTQNNSMPPRKDATKSEGKKGNSKSNMPTFVKKNEYGSKTGNSRQEISLGNKKKLTTNEKLLEILKSSSSEGSSDSDFLSKSSDKMNGKIGNKPNEDKKHKNEFFSFRNNKFVEEKERQDLLMNILGDEKIRRAYMKEGRKTAKKTPIFR